MMKPLQRCKVCWLLFFVFFSLLFLEGRCTQVGHGQQQQEQEQGGSNHHHHRNHGNNRNNAKLRKQPAPGSHPMVEARAISRNRNVSDAAIAQLRSQGENGLKSLLQYHKALLKQAENRGSLENLNLEQRKKMTRLNYAINKVSGQYDARYSRLYWFKDLESARDKAGETGKPILSLSLFGELDEEMSCTDARLFRTILYANKQISRILKNDFILHWQSVGPVAKMTMDLGHTAVQGTNNGHSVHHILDAEGRPLDALPGLFSPSRFVQFLTDGFDLNRRLASLPEIDRESEIRSFHEKRMKDSKSELFTRLTRKGPELQALPDLLSESEMIADDEFHMELQSLSNKVYMFVLERNRPLELRQYINSSDWNRLARLERSTVNLDSSSKLLFATKSVKFLMLDLEDKMNGDVKTALRARIDSFERHLALETVMNEYALHQQIRCWFLDDLAFDLADVNRKIYSVIYDDELDDKWMGALNSKVFTGLDNDGIVPAPTTSPAWDWLDEDDYYGTIQGIIEPTVPPGSGVRLQVLLVLAFISICVIGGTGIYLLFNVCVAYIRLSRHPDTCLHYIYYVFTDRVRARRPWRRSNEVGSSTAGTNSASVLARSSSSSSSTNSNSNSSRRSTPNTSNQDRKGKSKSRSSYAGAIAGSLSPIPAFTTATPITTPSSSSSGNAKIKMFIPTPRNLHHLYQTSSNNNYKYTKMSSSPATTT